MKLLILRHAKAHDADPVHWPDDSQRPLTAKGEKRTERSVKAIVKLVDREPTVITSPYARALKTAQILCDNAGWSEPTIDERLSAHNGIEEALDLLQELDGPGPVVIVGHDPTFSYLPGVLIGAERYGATELDTGAVAVIETHGAPVVPGSATLTTLMQPKQLTR